MSDLQHLKQTFQVESSDATELFCLWTRQNRNVLDDFSCGLKWLAKGSSGLLLLRYNGSSHRHPNHIEGNKIVRVCHMHRTTERYLQSDYQNEGFAEETDLYTTVQGALHQLVIDSNIQGVDTKPDDPELPL